ncbi:hypothetical protein F5Y10DRAFT_285564 [Nemania abortiva]|nr:hypothetical protein F5Y10DRAFT_285564 [Nemania abortiva]
MVRRKEITDSLRMQMSNNLVNTESKRTFIPDQSLAAIFTITAIEKAVNELDCHASDCLYLARDIQREGVKLFALLTWIKEEEHIVDFRSHRILDNCLPLSREKAVEVAPRFGARLATEQWMVLPFDFPKDMNLYHRKIEQHQIIPYINVPEFVGEGSSGYIDKIDIYVPQQGLFPRESDRVQIVRKKVKPKYQNAQLDLDFENEKSCLLLLNRLQHSNIILLLGSYTLDDVHYFLFPSLDMDVNKFLTLEKRHGIFSLDTTFYSALRGLCSALSHTHSLRLKQEEHGVDFDAIGYHHDIRPANILANRKTFVLADFGLGKVKDAQEQSLTHWVPTTGDYLAPECMDDNRDPQDVTRAIDVWAVACLIAVLATYIHNGPKGVEDFSICRRAPGRRQWMERVFYDVKGGVKTQAKEFLEALPDSRPGDIPISPLVQLSLGILSTNPRPKIETVCDRLTYVSLQAHFRSVLQKFIKYASECGDAGTEVDSNRLWFARERFRAWGWALWFLDDNPDVQGISSTYNDLYQSSIEIMEVLIDQLNSVLHLNEVSNPTKLSQETQNTILDNVQSLWSLLPARIEERADDYWNRSILNSDNVDHLKAIRRILASRQSGFNGTRSLAMMKLLPAAVLNPERDIISDNLGSWMIDAHDVDRNGVDDKSYTIGRFQGSEVLIEWMLSTPAWAKVHQGQRNFVMSLRARYFGMDHKPPSLRTLKCLGIFEEKGRRSGYGFVYQIPGGINRSPLSLHSLLHQNSQDRKNKPQPLLGDKFKLAFAIADFLKHFHMIGWLHERLDSSNIIFIPPLEVRGDGAFREEATGSPYFVGLHRSRPDGSLWQTAGPDGLSQFQHPQYVTSGRYEMKYDYYSLGLVLLEIGLWHSLDTLLKDHETLGGEEIRQEILKYSREQLGPRMGLIYRNVVVQCLQCLEGSVSGGEIGLEGEQAAKTADESGQTAILDIIHGDIKPENILIFPIESGKYEARLTDFGYSSRYMNEEGKLKLPISAPWNAPEVDRHGRLWTPRQARRADLFSTGMLFVWLLFEPYLSKSVDPPPSISLPDASDTMALLHQVKPNMKSFAQKLLMTATGLDPEFRTALETFLLSCLDNDPEKRDVSVSDFLGEINQTGVHTSGFKMEDASWDSGQDEIRLDQSLLDLYVCDYRVRQYLARCLHEEYDKDGSYKMSLAFCYLAGFGLLKDDSKARNILQQTPYTIDGILERFLSLQDHGMPRYLRFTDWYQAGHIGWPDDFVGGSRQESLKRAEGWLRREIQDVDNFFGQHLRERIQMNLSWSLARTYLFRDRWEDFERLLKQILEGFKPEQSCDDDDKWMVYPIYNNLLVAYQKQCKWEAADEVGRKAVSMAEKHFGQNHVRTMEARVRLSLLRLDQGQWKLAEKSLLDIVRSGEDVLGPEHPRLMRWKHSLGRLWLDNGKVLHAEEIAVQLSEIYRKVLGPDHPNTLGTVNFLIEAYIYLGKWKEALPIAERQFKELKVSLGEDNWQSIRSAGTLGKIYSDMGQLGDAEAVQGRVLENTKRMRGENPRQTVFAMGNLAETYQRQGRLDDAIRLRTEAVALSEAVFGNDSFHHMTQLNNLAQSIAVSGDLNQAEVMVTELLAKRRALFGPKHPDSVTSMNDLATIYRQQNRLHEAVDLWNQQLELVKEMQGEDAPNYMVIINNLGAVLAHQGKFEEAAKLFEESLAISRRLLGPDHPETLKELNNLAVMRKYQGRYEEAEVSLRRCLDIQRRVFTRDHPDTATCLLNLAMNLWRQGRPEEATSLMIECFVMRNRLFGPEHQATRACLVRLAQWRNLET